MDPLFIQSFIIALFCYLGWIATPWLGGQAICWGVFGRPLIAGTIVGLVLGDVKTGMIIGATINAIYIGGITPGGAMAADMNFAGYIGTFIAMKSNVSAEVALSLAVPIGLIGTLTWQLFATINAFTAQIADRYVAERKYKQFGFMVLGAPQILAFCLRFIPAFLVLYYGANFAKHAADAIPAVLTNMLTLIGGVLPAIGMAVLLKMLVKSDLQIAFFAVGFILIAVSGFTILTVSVIGLSVAAILLFIENNIAEGAENE